MNNYNNQYSRNNNNQYNRNNEQVEEKFDINRDWFDFAKKVMENESNQKNKITYTQLRNILNIFLSLKKDLDKKDNNELNNDEKNELGYIKIKLIYQIAKESNQSFYKSTQIEKRIECIKTKTEYKELIKYIEALVAYHKFLIKR